MLCNDLHAEPQIGIEPMTAWPDTGRDHVLPSENDSNHAALDAQGTPETAPKSAKSGNEVATTAERSWAAVEESRGALGRVPLRAGYHIILGVLAARRRRAVAARRARRAA